MPKPVRNLFQDGADWQLAGELTNPASQTPAQIPDCARLVVCARSPRRAPSAIVSRCQTRTQLFKSVLTLPRVAAALCPSNIGTTVVTMLEAFGHDGESDE
jgi:hypothetical protein